MLRNYVLIFLVAFSPLNTMAMDIDSLVDSSREHSVQLVNHHHHHDDDTRSTQALEKQSSSNTHNIAHNEAGDADNYEDCSDHKHCSGHVFAYIFISAVKIKHTLQIITYLPSNINSNYQTLLTVLYRPPIIAI